MILCILYALLYLVLFCLGIFVVWYVLTRLIAIMAPSLVVDPRIWQLLGLVLFLVVAIIIVQSAMTGGLCAGRIVGWR